LIKIKLIKPQPTSVDCSQSALSRHRWSLYDRKPFPYI
jgi:hypothetical protein